MLINEATCKKLMEELKAANVCLIAVSKIKPPQAINELYALGQRDFGENYVQELVEKQVQLPKDIHWHFIGHLQTNKVKYIAPFVYLIHGVDSLKLLKEIDKQAAKLNRTINVLLQVHIAREETKFGFDEGELNELVNTNSGHGLHGFNNIKIIGLMGMASFSEDENLVRNEFKNLKRIYDKYAQYQIPNFKFETLSMGMSGDYKLAIEEGSNTVRIGSLLFGKR